MDTGRQNIAEILLLCLLPLGNCAQGLHRLIANVQLGQRIVVPLYGNLLGLGLVSLLHHHRYKLRLIQAGVDDDFLPLLDINAAADDQLCIFS